MVERFDCSEREEVLMGRGVGCWPANVDIVDDGEKNVREVRPLRGVKYMNFSMSLITLLTESG